MKTSQRLLTALTVVFAGQVILTADTPPPPPEAPPAPQDFAPAVASAMEEVHRNLARVHETVARDVAHAQHAVLLAQAGHERYDAADVELNLPEPPEPPDLFHVDPTTGITLLSEAGSGGSTAPLVIAAGPVEVDALAETQEDLAILSRILSKAAARGGEPSDPMALGITLSSFPGLRRPQAMYLDGYGAVFMVNVSFPLAAPAEKAEAKPEKPTNTAWEQARRELYGQNRSARYGPRYGDAFTYRAGPGPKAAAFDADRVERLQRDLSDALKNGANLRHVKGEESLVVVISSPRGSGTRQRMIVRAEAGHSTFGGTGGTTTKREELVTGDGSAAASTMVLRVKKGEAEDFAAGKLGPDEFRKRVGVAVY